MVAEKLVTVRLTDLTRFVDRARWSPKMLDALSAEEYRKTLEAEIRLREVVIKAVKPLLDQLDP